MCIEGDRLLICMGCFLFGVYGCAKERDAGQESRLFALDVLAHPVKTFKEALSGGGTRWVDIPGSLAHCVELQLLCYFCRGHGCIIRSRKRERERAGTKR